MANRSTLGIVFLTVFLDLVGFGILIPIQPFFAERLGASPSVVTLLGASYSLMQFLFTPFWGRLSDRIGRRPVMLASTFISSLGYLGFALSDELWMLFACRMFSGFGAANIAAAQAIIADCTPPEGRAKGMGLVGAAFGLGFIFGPALGGLLVPQGLSAPSFAAAALCGLNFVLALVWLPETRRRNTTAVSVSWSGLVGAARRPGVGGLLALFLTYTVGFSLMEQVLGLFIEHHWFPAGPGESAARLTAHVLILVGVTATIVQGGLIGRFVAAFGERALVVAGGIVIAGSFLGLVVAGRAGSQMALFVVACGMALGTGLVNPSLAGLLSRSVGGDDQGGTLGLGQSLGALGRALGPSFAGLLFERNPALPLLVGAAILVACSGMAVRLPTPVRAT